MKSLFVLAALAAVALAVCGGSPSRGATDPSSMGLLAQMKLAFIKKNAHISRIHLLELTTGPSHPGRSYAALATALTPRPAEMTDELFGIFVVDSTLTKLEQVLEIFPSGRLQDYAVLIRFLGPDTLEVR